MLTPERWRRIEEAFQAVVDLPAGERAAALAARCGEDADLRVEVEAMLAAGTAATGRLRAVVGSAAAGLAEEQASPLVGRRLGAYRVLGEIGRGGMGLVYRAMRDDAQYRTEVAIKLLVHGLGTPQAVVRFRAERQILATLEHPGIVRLLDGGATDDGLPYLVMELVEGRSITRFADERHLSVRARVELFRQVCAAVQHAHQKLIVHRDLKPSNILVTEAGAPKLLDFGIAKLLADEEGAADAPTRTGAHLLTPEYASPEQVRGEPVSTATDVYSLGAVLYELVAGAPVRRVGAGGLEALRAMLESVPAPPSSLAPADRRRALAGDLDNIILKALAAEPHRRYASVAQLSEDLGRHLDGMPVEARPATWAYRAGRFVTRNRTLVAAATLVALALGAATAVSLRSAAVAREQARRAERRFADVRALANTLLFEVDDGVRDLEGATPVRELIVGRALTYLDGLAREAGDDDPALLRELAAAYMKIGDVQGGRLMPNLGRPKDGTASYAKARELVDRLVASGHDDDGTRWIRARQLVGAAEQTDTDWQRARAEIEAALASVAGLEPSTAADRRTLVTARSVLSDMALWRHDPYTAERTSRDLVAAADDWAARLPCDEARYWVALAGAARAKAMFVAADPDGALAEMERAIARYRALVEEKPGQASYRRELAFALATRAEIQSGSSPTYAWGPSVDDAVGAEASLREALPLWERLHERDPDDSRAAVYLAFALSSLANVVPARDDGERLRLFARARELDAGLPAVVRASPLVASNIWYAPCAMSAVLARAGRTGEARDALREGLDLSDAAAAPDRLYPLECRYLAARAEIALGDDDRARQYLEETAAGLRARLSAQPTDVIARVGLAATLDGLAGLPHAEVCALRAEAFSLWLTWPGAPTAYTRRQLDAPGATLSACLTTP